MVEPELNLSPPNALFDEQIGISITGLDPGTRVRLELEETSGAGVWESSATFESDRNGTIDLTRQSPVDGAYQKIRPMGLFQFTEQTLAKSGSDHVREVTLDAVVDGETVASASGNRYIRHPDVEVESIDRSELVAKLGVPPGDGPHPGLVVLGGTEGGIPWDHRAELLASRGYAVLAIAYLRESNLPAELEEIPLEYFEDAIEWFRGRPFVRSEPVGIVAWSRGTEAGFLLGSRVDAVRTVVAYAPTGVVFPSPTRGGGPPWTAGGENVPHISVSATSDWWYLFHALWRRLRRKPLNLEPIYRRYLDAADISEVEAASIAVEDIQDGILLISGGDDTVWPADRLVRGLVNRLRSSADSPDFECCTYDDAGHAITTPYRSTEQRHLGTREQLFGLRLTYGGTERGYADADADSWQRVLGFLDAHLASEERSTLTTPV